MSVQCRPEVSMVVQEGLGFIFPKLLVPCLLVNLEAVLVEVSAPLQVDFGSGFGGSADFVDGAGFGGGVGEVDDSIISNKRFFCRKSFF